jgi:hypothetical protein
MEEHRSKKRSEARRAVKHGEEQQSTNRSNKAGGVMKHGRVAKHREEQQSTGRSSEVVGPSWPHFVEEWEAFL